MEQLTGPPYCKLCGRSLRQTDNTVHAECRKYKEEKREKGICDYCYNNAETGRRRCEACNRFVNPNPRGFGHCVTDPNIS